MGYHHYKSRDFNFAQPLVELRKKVRLTQDEVASQIGVTEKTLRNWEGGSNYPTDAHLRRLIEFYLEYRAFTPEHEQEEVRMLWNRLYSGERQRASRFDELWFARVFTRWQTRYPKRGPLLPGSQLAESNSEPDIAHLNTSTPSGLLRGDWSEALDVSRWYGRADELAKLAQWVLVDRCRMVTVLGIGGIGKTTLTIKLVQQVAPHFACVLWCSLYNAPSLQDVLRDWLPILSEQRAAILPQSVERSLALLIECLQKRRCLLVFDNLETLFQDGSYRQGYEDYATLIRHVSQINHQSCLLLTSRELFLGENIFFGDQIPVRVFRMPGLELAACQQLLQEKGLFGQQEVWRELVQRYAGNPLALKIVAETIHEIFEGDIEAFLAQGVTTFYGIRHLLTQQFERLSPREQALMYWLAIEREQTSLEALRADHWPPISSSEVIEAMHALRNRSLIERGMRGAVFTLQPVVLEYVTERFITLVSEEIEAGKPALALTHALLQGLGRDYVRASQDRLLVQPVLDRLLSRLGTTERVEESLEILLQLLRNLPRMKQGYGGGNVVNLLVRLNGHIKGKDCSQLSIWQANLQHAEAQNTTFAGADLAGSVFMERIEGIIPAALSTDGQYIAAGTFTGGIQVWHASTGQPLLTLPGHTTSIWVLAFHPESTLLVSGGLDGLMKVWDISSGRCVSTVQAHARWLRSLAIHPAGRLLATSSDDGSIKLWDLLTSRLVEIWHEQEGAIGSVAFSPDGQLLACGDRNGIVKLWSLERKQCLWTSTTHHGADVGSVIFSPDGQVLASGGFDSLIMLWRVSDGMLLATLTDHTNLVYPLAFSPEGLLASGSYDHTIKLWQIGERGEAAQCLSTLHEHAGPVYSVLFGPAGLLVSSSLDSEIKLWQVSKSGKEVRCLRTLRGYSHLINAIAFSPNSKLLVSSENNVTVRRWETTGGGCLSAVPKQVGGSFALAFSPDGQFFAGSTPDHMVRVWKADSGQLVRILRGYEELLLAVAFSPDGRFLVGGGVDTNINLWEIESGQILRILRGHHNWVWSLAYSPDGRLLASGDSDGIVKLWEISSGGCLNTLHNSPLAVAALAFTPDGQTLLGCHVRKQVCVWDVNSGKCSRNIQGIGEVYWVQTAAFSSDSGWLATAAREDHTVKVWDMRTGHLWRSFSCQGGRPWAVAWSADQHFLASGTDEGMIVVWNWQTEECLMTLRGDRPYERMNISGVTGISKAQKEALKSLGASEEDQDLC